MNGVDLSGVGAGDDAAPRVILVVEDDELLRMLACEIIADGGHHTIAAVSTDEALMRFEARPDIALLFTDVDMPGDINGLGLARLIALRSQTLPIIVTTGAAPVGPNDLPVSARFLAKPYSPSNLLQMIADMLSAGAFGLRHGAREGP